MFYYALPIITMVHHTSVMLVQTPTRSLSAEDVGKIAKKISVKIESPSGECKGSGVILQKRGEFYTVLTAAHVMKCSTFKLTTESDSQVHEAIISTMMTSRTGIDLAVVKFRSQKNYQEAKIGDSNLLQEGTKVYVAGYPRLTQTIQKRVLSFRSGQVTANTDQPFTKKGYGLVYSNDTLPGMSGGPVLNEFGELVGIHGQGDRDEAGQKTNFNLGIPINRLGEVAKELGVQLDVEIARMPNNDRRKAYEYYIAANNKRKAGDFKGALADFDSAIGLSPLFSSAYVDRGMLKQHHLKDPQGALADYSQAIAINWKNSYAYNNRAMLKHYELNDSPGALKDYDQAIDHNDKYADAYGNRGLLKHHKLNDFPGALVDYNQAIALDSQSAYIYSHRGLLKAYKLNDPKGAVADYSQAIALSLKEPDAYYYRGLVKHNELNDLRGALTDYSQAINLKPKYSYAYYYRGLLKKDRLNDRDGAISDLRIAAGLFREEGKDGYSYLQKSLDRLRELRASE